MARSAVSATRWHPGPRHRGDLCQRLPAHGQPGDHYGLVIIDEVHHFGLGLHDEALEMVIAPLRMGLTATPAGPGAARDRLETLVGPVVFELQIADLKGAYLAPLERITLRLRLDDDERRAYRALVDSYRRAYRVFLGSHLNGSWEDFLRNAGQTDECRRGLTAWRRARRLLAYPVQTPRPWPRCWPATAGSAAGVRPRQRRPPRNRARAPHHALHL